jgi:hypothetical protein
MVGKDGGFAIQGDLEVAAFAALNSTPWAFNHRRNSLHFMGNPWPFR